jgi:hypothetical protein
MEVGNEGDGRSGDCGGLDLDSGHGRRRGSGYGQLRPDVSHDLPGVGTVLVEGATEACGFPVTLAIDARVVQNFLFDATGNFVHAVITSNGTATESANGITLSGQIEDNQIFFDKTQQLYEVGLVDVQKLPGGGVVQIDVGRIVWSFDAFFGGGDPTFVAGPHQALEGDFAALCAALTP